MHQNATPTLSRPRSLIQASSPSVSVMSARRPGLQKASQRRGVTPLVLFWNFSGKTAKNWAKTSCLRISEWIAATPLTRRAATTAR